MQLQSPRCLDPDNACNVLDYIKYMPLSTVNGSVQQVGYTNRQHLTCVHKLPKLWGFVDCLRLAR